jgi:hypothetical protein
MPLAGGPHFTSFLLYLSVWGVVQMVLVDLQKAISRLRRVLGRAVNACDSP